MRAVLQDPVKKLVEDFKRKWNPLLEVSPVLGLDGTWPSVSVLDLLTFSLRLSRDVPDEVRPLITGAAAYLAEMADRTWSLEGAEVTVGIEQQGIVIRAQGGSRIPEGEEIVFEIEEQLAYCLRELPFPFPIIGDVKRPISFDSNILSLFGIGALSGLGPYVKGSWQRETAESSAEQLLELKKLLARQCAERYARLYPNEPWGQVAELYLGLIYPPIMVSEHIPAQQSSRELLAFFSDYKVGKEKMLQVAHNLVLSPDELISVTGLAFYGALAESVPPPEIIAAAQAKGRLMGLLRHTMTEIRAELKLGEDWLIYGIRTDADKMRYRIETAMEFLPWLYLSADYLEEKRNADELLPLMITMAAFDMSESVKIANRLLERTPGDLELRMQRIKLEMVRGGEAEEIERMFSLLLSEPDADASARFFNLWGIYKLQHGEIGSAEKYFKAALAIIGNDDPLKADLSNNLAWSHISAGQLEEALPHLDFALRLTDCPVTALLNKAHALWRLRRYEEVYPIRKRLFQIAPTDRRVFSTLGFRAGIESQSVS